MKITKEQANEIAQAAMEEAGYSITEYAGYFQIWKDDNDPENNYAVAINKEADENGNDKHFAIYVSIQNADGFWEYTDELDIEELSDTLMEIVHGIDIEEAKLV